MDATQTEQVQKLLKGAFDLHMHAAPSPFHRALDDYGLLAEADAAGMAGILLKSHYESTAARAALVNEHSGTAAKAYGAVVLNCPVGGLNLYAAVNALEHGAKVVFLPTRDSANSLCSGDMPGDFFTRVGITVLDGTGALKPEVFEIMEQVKRYNAALATGHLSPAESLLVCREGVRRGVRMVLTHPEFSRTVVAAETQRELAEQGVLIEKCWYNIAENECTAAEMAQHIKTVGAEHCFLCTDRGQKGREHPVEGMKLFMTALLQQGITEQEIFVMTHTVPQKVLGLA